MTLPRNTKMDTDTYIWLTQDLQTVDPRGWSDTFMEVAKEVPQLATHMQEEEILRRAS